jgi:L-fuculose-phosphate aldolase
LTGCTMILENERKKVVEFGKNLSISGLCRGTSGNLSIYDPISGYIAISPSGMDYMTLEPEDITVIDLDGNVIEGSRKPSSEWSMHAEFYKNKPGVRSIIHTHSVFCTTFSVLGMPIRAVHFAIGAAGTGEIPCAPYVLFGTKELGEAAVKACRNSNAVLLKNHGIVCCGKDIVSAYSLASNLEYVAELQYRAMSIGTPQYISDADLAKVLEKFASYGQ